MMRWIYAIITASMLVLPSIHGAILSLEQAIDAIEYLDPAYAGPGLPARQATADRTTLDPSSPLMVSEVESTRASIMHDLTSYIIQDDTLTPEECELLLSKLAELDSSTIRACKTYEDKTLGYLAVKNQLLAKNLTVCGNTILNNLTVDGTFYICGVPACDLVRGFTLLLTATSADIPHTLVLRDTTGSFAATTITVTGAVVFQAPNDQDVTLLPNPSTATYSFQLPPNGGTNGYVLATDGSGHTFWEAVSVVGAAGITMLNGLTTSTQFFAVGTAGTGFNIISAGNTHTFNLPLASTLTVTGGVISNTDYMHFQNTYTTVLAATPLDVPNTLVLRDNTGSFAATNVSLQAANTNQVTLAPNPSTNNYTLQLPGNTGTVNYVLTTDGTGVTSWQATAAAGITTLNGLTTSTQFFANGYAGIQPEFNSAINTHTLNIPLASTYGVLAGLITSTDYYNFSRTFTAIINGTPLNIPNTLVLRDNTGSFAAQNITAATIETCSIVSTCTYLLIEVDGGYQLVLQPDISVQPSFEFALAGQPTMSLELLLCGSGALYAQSNALTTGAARGAFAIDLQLARDGSAQVASGVASALVGGENNTATGAASGVFVGLYNSAASQAGVAIGGISNIVTGTATVIIGGIQNTGSGLASAMIGGVLNLAAGQASAAVGGNSNQALGITSVVLGGQSNVACGGSTIASGGASAVVGGENNNVSGYASGVFAGTNNIVTGTAAVVIGGSNNQALGFNSWAAGSQATALQNNSFVWCDGTTSYTSNNINTFNVQATGGVFMTGINGATAATGVPVYVSTVNGQLGTINSSRRYKENIKPMVREYSAGVLQLQPVTFNYKTSPDVESLGLIAEDVHELLPQLVIYNAQGEPESVRYHDLPVLLLNELKVATAAIHELYEKNKKLEDQLAVLREQVLAKAPPLLL